MSLVETELSAALHAQLQQRLPQALYEQWFAGAEIMAWDGRGLELGVKNRFFKNWIETKYYDVLKEAAGTACGVPDLEIKISVSANLYAPFREAQERDLAAANAMEVGIVFAPPPGSEETAAKRAAARPALNLGMDLHPDFTFANYVAGAANRLAQAVGLKAVESPGLYGRIYLWGEHGVGKTHLLQAICHETLKRKPGARVLYVTCERFVADFLKAHAEGDLVRFRELYRSCDLLAMDQLQVLGQGNKAATQAELLGIIDHLEARGKQMLFAGVSAPGDVKGVEVRLRDRLGSGFVDRMLTPDQPMRREIIARKFTERGLSVPEEGIELLARESTEGMRRLEGALSRLLALVEEGGMEPGLSCIRMALDGGRAVKRQVLLAEDIVRVVGEEFGVGGEALLGRGRLKALCQPRQLAAVLCRRLLGMRYAELGELFGGRSHATMMSLVKSLPPELTLPGLGSRPVERVLFRLGVGLKPEELGDSQRRLF